MKIMVLADTPDRMLWDNLDRRLLEGIDLVLSCGDLPAEYLEFLTCFTEAPVLYVHGNHDAKYDSHPPEGCICVEDDIYTFHGVRILGLGGSARYKAGPHMYTEKEMRRRVRRLRFLLWRRRGFDILLTHAPAEGLGDGEDRAHRGFAVFRDLVEKYRPAYMVYGHVHREYSFRFTRVMDFCDTKLVNANKRYVIELPDRE